MDNAEYWFDKVMDLFSNDYTHCTEDYLKLKRANTGITFYDYKDSDDNKCQLIDVGGERSERKKWRCLQWETGMDSVLYVCAMNQYATVTPQDFDINGLKANLECFQWMIDKGWLNNKKWLYY